MSFVPPAMAKVDVKAVLAPSLELAARAGHRRLVVLASNEPEKKLGELVECVPKARTLLLVAGERGGVLYKAIASKREDLKVAAIQFADVESVLGKTFDILVADLAERFSPNDIGRLVEVVRGGGLAVLIMPPVRELGSLYTSFHEHILRAPFKPEDIAHRFEKRFVKKLGEHEGIWVLDDDEGLTGKEHKPELRERRKPDYTNPPKGIPEQIFRLAATQDQVRALREFAKLLAMKGRRALLLTANRGRGKSAVLGLMLAALMSRKKGRGVFHVTAPSLGNAEVVFLFARLGLRAYGRKPAFIKGVEEGREFAKLKCGPYVAHFVRPFELMTRDVDVAIVDEAAGIPVDVLFAIASKAKLAVFASTVHGYEGAGRGFSLRFCGRLKSDPSIRLAEVTMTEPIRYSEGDPIEAWLYDTLALNAEPPKLEQEVVNNLERYPTRYAKLDLDELFENDELLSSFVGIYVSAHYRNRPDDLMILGDAPAQRARALTLGDGTVVVAMHVAEEGGLPDEEIRKVLEGELPPGNLVPFLVVKYYEPYKEFAKLRGARVVRIATHPSLFRRGLGSRALSFLSEELRSEGFDWLGAGFGASYEVLKFWVKNGFIPIHLSPSRNPSSGEFSAVVVKPFTERASRLVSEVSREFRLRMIYSMQDPYYYLPPAVGRLLFQAPPETYRHVPSLTESQLSRIERYSKGGLVFESCKDAALELAKAHFLSSGDARLKLTETEETVLVAKCLQGKSWRLAAEESGVEPAQIKGMVRAIVSTLFEFYVKEVIS